jgi:hypothetical protein
MMSPCTNSKWTSISSAFAFQNQLRHPLLPSLAAGVLTPRLSSRGDDVVAGVSAVARRSGSLSRGGDLCAGQRAPFLPSSPSPFVCYVLLCFLSSAPGFSFRHRFNKTQKKNKDKHKIGLFLPRSKNMKKNAK